MLCSGSGARPHVIALVPVRDEQWTLRRCLETASAWADHIIIADQQSRDRSVEIARAFPKVVIIENRDRDYSEVSRQRQLIDAARRLCPGPRVLLGIDADEILSANVIGDEAWERAIRAAPGTLLKLNKIVLRSMQTYVIDLAADRGSCVPFGYADDGAPHDGAVIHTTRVPEISGAPAIDLPHIAVLHFNLCNPERSARKDCWYQCYERVHEGRDVVEIRRRYDWLERQPAAKIRPMRPEWCDAWRQRGIDLANDADIALLWCDVEILRIFANYGTEPFRFFDFWSADWEALRKRAIEAQVQGIGDRPIVPPMALVERIIRGILAHQPPNRWADGVLRRWCKFLDRRMGYDRIHASETAAAGVESHG